MLPATERVAALIATARDTIDDEVVDRTLLAASAQLLVALGREEVVPELRLWSDLEGLMRDEDSLDADAPSHSTVHVATLVGALDDLLRDRSWHATAPSEDRERARRFVELAKVSLFDGDPIRIRSDAEWMLPRVGERLQLEAWPVAGGRHELADLLQSQAPAEWRQVVEPSSVRSRVVPLPVGNWQVEWRSLEHGWRAVRRIEVSDLDVVGVVGTSRFAAFGIQSGAVAELAAWLRDAERGRSRVAPIGESYREFLGNLVEGAAVLDVRDHEGHPASIHLPHARLHRESRPADLAHLMVDRPVYRRGEPIQGRVVVHSLDWDGEGIDARVSNRPAAGESFSLRVFVGTDQEKELALRADALGHAAFVIEVPRRISDGDVRFRLERPGSEEVDEVPPILETRACRVAEFVRPTLALEVFGPTELAHDGEPDRVDVVLAARWASGGPASGLEADVVVRGLGAESQHRLATDEAGRAICSLDVSRLASGDFVEVRFDVVTPEGRSERLVHRIRRRSGPTRAPTPQRLSAPARGTVGQEMTVALRGTKEGHVLVVRGRGARLEATVVQLDLEGRAEFEVEPRADEWPVLDLALVAPGRLERLRVPLARAVVSEPRIEMPERIAPGAAFDVVVDVGAPGTLVTVAVVDARIFDLGEDRTTEPRDALVPAIDREELWRFETEKTCEPLDALANLLVDGCVLAPGIDPWGSVETPGPGGAAPGPYGGASTAALRSEFRATAAFRTAVSDADGVARIPISMPDDVADWRVTVVSVSPEGEGFLERRSLCTRLPMVAEPRLPRVMREGDAVDVPVVVDASGAEGLEGAEAVRATVDVAASGGLGLEASKHPLDVAPGRTATVEIALRAGEGTTGVLDTALSVLDPFAADGTKVVDRSRRTLPILPDAVLRRVSATTFGGAGSVAVAIPEGVREAESLEITVLAARSAVRQMLREQLEQYPYGCVEQTLSSILPFFAEARGRRARGEATDLPEDPGFRERLDAGFQRLRQLQVGAGGGFAWWRGEGPDREMTALVLHGLCVLREAGFDPDGFGLGCDPAAAMYAPALERVASEGPADWEDLELVVALLRRRPDDPSVVRIVTTALEREFDRERGASGETLLAPGLAARAGLALWTIGEFEAAGEWSARADSLEPERQWFPGEDPVAIAASRLELRHRLVLSQDEASDAASRVQQEAAVLRHRVLSTWCSTYAQSVALAALALVDAESAEAEVEGRVVTLRSAEERWSVELSEESGHRATLRVPEVPGSLRLDVEGGVEGVDVVVTGTMSEAGSAHTGWSSPVEVRHRLLPVSTSDVDEEREPVEGPLVRGRLYELEVEARCPDQHLRYLVVEVPMPAGFEMPREQPGVEVFDDRLAYTVSWLRAGRSTIRHIPLIATRSGTMVWPPVVARAMYQDDLQGGSAGRRVTVVAAPEQVPSTVDVGWTELSTQRTSRRLRDDESTPERRRMEAYQKRLSRRADRLVDLLWDAHRSDPGGLRGSALVFDEKVEAQIRTAVEGLRAVANVDQVRTLVEFWFLSNELPLTDEAGILREGSGPGAGVQRGEVIPRGIRQLVAEVESLRREALDRSLRAFRADRVDATLRRWKVVDVLARSAAQVASTAERAALLAELVDAGVERSPCALEWTLRWIDEPTRSPLLADAIWRGLTTKGESLCEFDAFAARLPADRLVLLPERLIRAVMERGAASEAWRALLQDPYRGTQMRAWLEDPEFARELAWEVDRLTDLVALRVPLAVWRSWSGEFVAQTELIDALAGSRFRDDELATELRWAIAVGASDADGYDGRDLSTWRCILAAALCRRGVAEIGGSSDRGSLAQSTWQRALDLAVRRDVTGLHALRAEVLGGQDGPEWFDEGLLRFVELSISAMGGVDDILGILDDFSEVDWDALRDRLGVGACCEILATTEIWLDPLPSFDLGAAGPRTLLRYGLRVGDLEDATEAVCATVAGARRLRELIAAGAVEEIGREAPEMTERELERARTRIEELIAHYLGEDCDVASRLVRLAGRYGLERDWTAEEQELLDAILKLRGF